MSQPVGPTMPTIGRIVHVSWPSSRGPVTVPAIVTAVVDDDGTIQATAFPPGIQPVPLTANHVEPTPDAPVGTWHWPAIR